MLKFSMIIALLACATAPAYAQYDRAQECWNPHAGHFERVRPGETQNEHDQRCRSKHSVIVQPNWSLASNVGVARIGRCYRHCALRPDRFRYAAPDAHRCATRNAVDPRAAAFDEAGILGTPANSCGK